MSPDQAALCCFLFCSAVMADPSAPLPEKVAFLAAAVLLSLSVMAEVGRQNRGGMKSGASRALEIAAVLSFLSQLALVGYRFLDLK